MSKLEDITDWIKEDYGLHEQEVMKQEIKALMLELIDESFQDSETQGAFLFNLNLKVEAL